MRPCLYVACREPAVTGRGVCLAHLEELKRSRPETHMTEFFAYETVGMSLPYPTEIVPIGESHFPMVSWSDTTGRSWDLWTPWEEDDLTNTLYKMFDVIQETIDFMRLPPGFLDALAAESGPKKE